MTGSTEVSSTGAYLGDLDLLSTESSERNVCDLWIENRGTISEWFVEDRQLASIF